ncbi:MAG: Uncharacterized protein G01um10147_415 [Microgenomates group bacterium Gr01-1014_7]|nr:MAG: Uncharacterized protein G01um10147_415 [Microgenomates group bacterium Gr01-1014_7]
MKVLITGAHFTPAVAVINELKKYKDTEVVYVGRKTTLEGDKAQSAESQILPGLGVKFIPIITGRLQRSFTIYTIPSLLKIPIGLLQALYIILSEKPDVILSFGGYVAVPTLLAGWLFSIPIIIHEQGIVSGLANRISSVFADKIAVSFPTQNPKAILTGNPLRRKMLDGVKLPHPSHASPEAMPAERGVNILVTGGNQGSHVINLAVEESLDKLIKIASIIHVTGDNKFGDFERLEKRRSEKYIVKKWIGEEWGQILKKVDLVVSRAGINTLNELAYLGIPALVIPIPYLFENEQNKNAKYFEGLGLAKILPQSKLSGKSLLENIRLMVDNLDMLKKKAENAKKIVIPDAAKRLALETILMV